MDIITVVPRIYTLLVLVLVVFSTGCTGETGSALQTELNVAPVLGENSVPVSEERTRMEFQRNTATIDETPQISACTQELEVLKRINSDKYAMHKKKFDLLMTDARVYSDVRGGLQGGTRNTVDAFFSYRVGILCADISQDVLKGLSHIREGNRH